MSLVKLGDVASVIAGQSPKGENYNKNKEGMPFYQGKRDYGVKFLKPPTIWTKVVTKVAKSGDLLFSVRAPVGALNFATQEICIGRGLAAIRAQSKVDNNYLYYVLSNISNNLNVNAGAIFNSISKKQIEDIKFFLPSLEKQKHIVSKIDYAFAEIDKATFFNDKNILNIKAFFDNVLDESFKKLDYKLELSIMNDACELIDSLHKTPKYEKTGIPMIRVTDIKPGLLRIDNAKKVSKETYLEFSKRHKSEVGDIVFSRVGSYGVCAIVSSEEPFCLGQNTVFIIPKIKSKYLYYFLNSPFAKKQIDKLVGGVTQPTISLKSIRSLKIPIASKIEQEIISEKFTKIDSNVDNLLNLYKNKSKELMKLKSSLLKKFLSN